MKEKFERGKRTEMNIGEVAQKIWDEKTKNMTPEEKEAYAKKLEELLKSVNDTEKLKALGYQISDSENLYNQLASSLEVELISSEEKPKRSR